MHGRGATALLLLALCVAMLFLGFMLAATDGHFIPQVADLYLVCQYARAMAEGHPFQYNAGEPASTGSTSLLHTTLLAAAHAVGARGEALVAFAILIGAGFYVASVLAACRLGTRLGGEREGVLAGALVALGGPVVWGFLYGSDIALFACLSLLLFEKVVSQWDAPRPWGMAVAGSLLALARPEGLVIALALGAAWSLGPGRAGPAVRRALIWLPTGAGLSVLVLYRTLTGQWQGTSMADKSLFANYGLAEGLALVAEYGVDVLRGLLLGFYPSQVPVGFARGWAPFYFPPLGLLLILVALVRAPRGQEAPLRTWSLIVASTFALVAPNVFMGVHFNRYILWGVPTLLVLVAIGLGTCSRAASRGDPSTDTALFRGGAALLVLLGILSTLRFAALYGGMAGDVYRRDWAAAQWIAREIREGRLPAGVPMANLATSVEYLTGHRNINLHGVTSPAFFGNTKAEREAGVFEALGRLPENERPPYLISSVSAQESYPSMRELVQGEPLYRTSSFGDEILVYRMRYDLVGRNAGLFLASTRKAVGHLREVDRLNVCDSRDEAAHDYSYTSHVGDLRLQGTARIDSYPPPVGETVIDAGRAIVGSESFRVRTVRGRTLLVVMRTAAAVSANVLRAGGSGQFPLGIPEARIAVSIDGLPAARVAFRAGPGWDEQVLRIPGSFLSDGETQITLSGRYASFYYWFFQ